jgi:hypothetical protein
MDFTMINLLAAASLAVLTGTMPATRLPANGHAQAQTAVSPAQDSPAPVSDRAVNASEPDFTLVALPTTLRVPRFASAFRVTHRFTRPLGEGDPGDLANDFFGFDSSAQIGLEYRFGIMSATQIGIHRTSDRTIEFFLQRGLVRQGTRMPVTVDALLTAEGTNNFRDKYSPSVGALISRTFGRHGAVYLEPMWVNNTNTLPSEVVDDNNTVMVGIGGRVRIRPTVYLVAEAAPHFGYRPDVTHASFAIEKRVGGHAFQINFSNGFGTTMAQTARGGVSNDNWYIGFNISRKFF